MNVKTTSLAILLSAALALITITAGRLLHRTVALGLLSACRLGKPA